MTAIADRLLGVEARLDRAEARLSRVRRFVDEVAALDRRVTGATAVVSRHRPAHGSRVLAIHLLYVLGGGAGPASQRNEGARS